MEAKDRIESFERELLQTATRKNAERVSELLADDFREFGSSGRVYTKSKIIALLQTEQPRTIELTDFQANFLTPEIALVTYRTQNSLRSSLWIFQSNRWQLLFHQGTTVPATIPTPE